MGDPKNYRMRAQECAALAANTQSQQHKAVWEELEEHWLNLANTLELSDRVDPFTAFLTVGARSRVH